MNPDLDLYRRWLKAEKRRREWKPAGVPRDAADSIRVRCELWNSKRRVMRKIEEGAGVWAFRTRRWEIEVRPDPEHSDCPVLPALHIDRQERRRRSAA